MGQRAEVAELKARIAALEQLLAVYERSVMEQSEKLYAEQERLGFQTALLECQGEASPDGILSVGRDGRILFANRRFWDVWRVDPDRIEMKSHQTLLAELAREAADPDAFLEQSVVAEGDEGRGDEIALADGRVLEQYTAPILGPEGTDFGHVWYFRDISAAKEVSRMKNEFISSVSHELRTPLTSLLGSLGLMEAGAMGELPAEASEMVETAKRNCNRLVRLINDILDVEKIESRRIPIRMQVMELDVLLKEMIEAIRPYGESLGVDYRFEGSASGARVRVDPDRLQQVMENLLSNAAKFSPLGEHVRIRSEARGPFVRVSVTDRGPGVDPELEGRLFEKFARGASGTAQQMTGTGLGLNISRAIVVRFGGKIDFRREAGGGTTFYFDLPAWQGEKGEETTP